MADQGWEEYWRTHGQQFQDWAEQAKKQSTESLHMPRYAVLPSIWKVENPDKLRSWRDQEPML